VSGPGRGAVGQHPQQLIAEARGEHGGKGGDRHGAGEHGRGQLAALALPADVAVVDVPADPLAHQHGEPPVPAGQHGVEAGAGVPPGPRDDQRAERSLQLAAGPGQQRVGVVAGHPERGGEFVALEFLHQAQLDDVPVARVQPVHRGPDQLAELGLFRGGADIRARRRDVGGLVEGGQRLPGPQPAEALVARDRVEPGTQPGRVPQVPQLGGRDEKGVLNRVGGVGGLVQQGTAVRVERRGVPVVRFGEPGGVTSHDGSDNLRVLHAHIP
jgi:hypothetical protein